MTRCTSAWAVALSIVLGACLGEGTGPNPVPSRLTLETTGGKFAPAGQPLPEPITVRVTDSAGKGVSGVLVTFAVSPAGGSLSASSVRTDGRGRASTVWTIGTAAGARYWITAASTGLAGSPLRISATALPGPAAALAVASGEDQLGNPGRPLERPIQVRVVDAFGNPAPRTAVGWHVASGGGAVGLELSTTGPNGIATATWTLGAVGRQTLEASVLGVATPLAIGATALDLAVTAVSLDTLVEGRSMVLTGQGLDQAPALTTVAVDGIPAAITAIGPTGITATVPGICHPPHEASVEVRIGGASAAIARPWRPSAYLSLPVGAQRVLAPPDDLCLQLAPSAGYEAYLVGVQAVVENATFLRPVVLTSEVAPAAGSGSFRTPVPRPLHPVDGSGAQAASAGRWTADAAATRVRARSLARPIAVRATTGGPSASAIPSGLVVGDVIPIRVPALESPCNYTEIQAMVRAVGARGVWLEDMANPTGGYTAADYQRFGAMLDGPIYGPIVDHFGAPPDVDGNGRIGIVVTRWMNWYPNVLGAFFYSDFLDRSGCASSNGGEIVYVRAPDPNGTGGPSPYPLADARAHLPRVLAHELGLLAVWGRRVVLSGFVPGDVWELEGLATLAEEIAGFAEEGRGTGQNLGLGVAYNVDDPGSIDWFSTAFGDLASYAGFVRGAGKALGAPEECSFLSPGYLSLGPCPYEREENGLSWLLLRWVGDQYGPAYPGGAKALFRSLVDGGSAGFAGLSRVTGVPIGTLLAQWAATLYVDDRLPGMDPRLTLPTWNLFDIQEGAYGTFRLSPDARLEPRERGFASYVDAFNLRGGSSSYHRVSGAARPATAIRIRGPGEAPVPPGVQLWVVRLQ